MSLIKPYRKGNPNWVKGKSANPKGRPKGAKSIKGLLKVAATLVDKKRDPVNELIWLAELAKANNDLELAADIWRDLLKYVEPQKKPTEDTSKPATPEASKAAAEATHRILQELEDGFDTGTAEGSDKSSLGTGQAPVQAEANSADSVRPDQGEQGKDICSELHSPGREDVHNGNDSHGDCTSNP